MDIVAESSDTSMNDLWDVMWKTFKNASLTYDQAFTQNITKINNNSIDINIFENPAKLGIFTGLFVAWFTDFRVGPIKGDRILNKKMKLIGIWIFNITFFLLFTPFVTIFLSICFLYRKIVTQLLKKTKGNEFISLLEGTDCVWTIEDERAFSVINVLGFLELKKIYNNEPLKILDDLKKIIKERLISKNFDKLCWLRDDKYGYYYWKKSNASINLDERIRWLDDHEECDGTCGNIYNGYLRKIINNVCNKPLPNHHCTNWEILVGKNCEKYYNNNIDKINYLPLLFRIHHSLGDGVALLRLLLEAIADNKDNESIKIIIDTNSKTYLNNINKINDLSLANKINEPPKQIIYYTKDLLDVLMPFSVSPIIEHIITGFIGIKNNINNIFKEIGKFMREFIKNFIVLISIPSCLVEQALASMDNSALHGPLLTGDKIISCWMESDFIDESEDYGLLDKIRDIKNLTKTRFGDVILAALSANFHNYFIQIGEAIPNTVTAVIPARMSAPSKQLDLKNRFSVGLVPLCVGEINGKKISSNWNSTIDLKCKNLLERLDNISRCSKKLRNKPDYIINYWVMTWLSAALPKKILKPFLKSYSTLVFSNLPGPNKIDILENTLEKIAFWIPHRGTTGIGFSFLTYGGKAHFSVVVDKGIVTNEKLLDEIVNGTVNDINKLHEYMTISCKNGKFFDQTKAPMETGFSVHQ